MSKGECSYQDRERYNISQIATPADFVFTMDPWISKGNEYDCFDPGDVSFEDVKKKLTFYDRDTWVNKGSKAIYKDNGEYGRMIGVITGHFEVGGLFNRNPVLKTIEQWGDNVWRDLYPAFAQSYALESVPKDMPNISRYCSLDSMFYHCGTLNCDFRGWDIGKGNDVRDMFLGANSMDLKKHVPWYNADKHDKHDKR